MNLTIINISLKSIVFQTKTTPIWNFYVVFWEKSLIFEYPQWRWKFYINVNIEMFYLFSIRINARFYKTWH